MSHSVSALAQQEKNPSFLVVKLQLRESKKKDPEHFFCWDLAFPKTSEIQLCSFVPRWAGQNHRISLEQRCSLKGVSQVGETEDIDHALTWHPLEGLRGCGLPVKFSVFGMSRFSRLIEFQDEYVSKIILETSASQHFSDAFCNAVNWHYFQLGNPARALFPASISSPCWRVSILEQSFCDMHWFYPGEKSWDPKNLQDMNFRQTLACQDQLRFCVKTCVGPSQRSYDLQTSRPCSPLLGRLPWYLDPQDPPWDLRGHWCLPHLPGIPVFLCHLFKRLCLTLLQQLKHSRMKFPRVKPRGSMSRCYGLWKSFCCNGHGWRVGLT